MKIEANRTFIFPPRYAALLSLCVACLVASSAPIFTKWAETEVSAASVVFYKFFFGSIIFGLVNAGSDGNNRREINRDSEKEESKSTELIPIRTVVLLIVCAGICGTFNQVLWAISLTQTSVGKSALLHSLAPLFTALFSLIFLKRKIEYRLLVGMAIAIGGSTLLAIGDFQESTMELRGDGFALLSAMFIAFYFSLIEELRNYLGSSMILLWRCLLGTVLVLPVLLMSSDFIIPTSAFGWSAVMGVTLTFAITHWLVAFSLAVLSSTLVAVVLLVDPLLASIQAWIFFSEKLQVLEWVALFIVIFGVYLSIAADMNADTESKNHQNID